MKKLRFFVLCLCLLTSAFLRGQDLQQNTLDFFAGKFIAAIRSSARPKAMLITDKSVYSPGEHIWFRGFLLNSVSQKVTSKSKYLFVDLVNEKDSVVSVVLLNAATQQLSSNIKLPREMPGGYYWLRAYTRQMAEGDTNNAFIKPIFVTGARLRPNTANARSIPSLSDSGLIVKFYPEGGSIITGVNSVIGFTITNSQGKPVAAEGYVKDSRDSIAAKFTSNEAGVGKFQIFASSFRKYKAIINWNGKDISYALPPFNLYAGQISVSKQAEGNDVLRVLLEDSIYKKDVVTYVLGISRDSLCFAAIGRGQYQLVVPENKFPEGIASFYLFDSNLKLLSERSIYVKQNNLLVNATVDKSMYAKREKVTLHVSITDGSHMQLPSLFSVSVTDTASGNFSKQNDVPDISKPQSINNASLSGISDKPDEYLDLIMLLKSNSFPGKMSNPVADGFGYNDSLLFITGKALTEKDMPAANKILTLLSGTAASFLVDTTNTEGQFSFPVFDYADSTQFAIESKDLNAKTANITIVRQQLVFPHFSTPLAMKNQLPAEPVFTGRFRHAYLDTTVISIGNEMLKDVTVSGKKKKGAAYNEEYRVSPSSTIIAADQLDERTTVGNIVMKVGGLHMVQGVLIINGLTSMKAPDANSEPMLIINGAEAPKVAALDESPLLATLNSFNPKDIDFIEILKGPEASNYGLRGGNGVIIINTVHTRRDVFTPGGSNLQTFYARGIAMPSQFPVINYDNKTLKASETYDNRSTIFWNGSVLTGTDQYAVSFFTSDVPTTYKVTISGITNRGDLIYKTLMFDSK